MSIAWRFVAALAFPIRALALADSQTVPLDAEHLDLQGKAALVEFQSRPCLKLDGGAAIVKDLEFQDGDIEFDALSTGTGAGFFGMQFRIDPETNDAEWIYLRPHKSGLADAIQYVPVVGRAIPWQIYNGPGFNAPLEIARDTWHHVRISVSGASATLFVGDMTKPCLEMPDLKSGVRRGGLAFAVLIGTTYFSNLKVSAAPAAAWERHEPPMLEHVLARWSLSPAFDAPGRVIEKLPARAEFDAMQWDEVVAEAPGFVVINRYRDPPQVRATFMNDFARRLEPQTGAKMVYARHTIQSEREELRRLRLGYSDEVTVFLNGEILFRGRSPQYFRDPGFLGIVNAENDAIYLRLKPGVNEIVLAITELGGGWGFIARMDRPGDPEEITTPRAPAAP